MAYESFIGLRYLMAKRQKSVLSIITIISIVGVALGVTALIVVLSVMGGFRKDLMQKILGTKAHIVIKHADDSPIEKPIELAEKLIKWPHITGASPFIEAEAMVSSPTNIGGIVLRGIDVNLVTKVNKLDKDMQQGTLQNLVDPDKLLKQLDKQRQEDIAELRKKLGGGTSESVDEKLPPPALGEKKDVEKSGAEKVAKEKKEEKKSALPEIPPPLDTISRNAAGTKLDSPKELDDFVSDIPDDDTMPDLLSGADLPKEQQQKGFLPTIIIGAELAHNLKVSLGDEINVVTPNGGMGPSGPIPKSRPFVIVGVFYTGMYEFDSNYAYTTLENAENFVGIQGADGLELKTDKVEHSTAIAQALRKELGPDYKVMDWEELNKSLFFALRIEKLAMFVVLTFIILVASFSIVAMLIMIVIEKGREIAILKSMGVTNRGIMRIFIFQGSLIGSLGSAIGCVLGISICLFLKYVGIGLDSEVYYISTLPVEMNPIEITIVLLSALTISVLATLYPAYQASILAPVQGLRYD